MSEKTTKMRNGKQDRYTLEFKQEVARLVESGQGIAAVVRSLAVVIDLFSRMVVNWSMRLDMYRSQVIDVLEMGVYQRRPQPGSLIFHSDRGSNMPARTFATSSKSTASWLR